MTKTIEIPAIVVTVEDYSQPHVQWTDGEKNYHIWLNDDGTPQNDVIHSNPIIKKHSFRVDEHRALSQSAKRWAPLVQGILAKIKNEGLLEKAREENAAKKAFAEAEAERIYRDKCLKRYASAMEQVTEPAREMLNLLDDNQRFIFVQSIQRYSELD